MYQTIKSPDVKTELAEGTRRAVTLDIRDETQKPNLTNNSPLLNKIEIVKLRGNNKPSVSPDRYTINPNLVVNLTDQIKKP